MGGGASGGSKGWWCLGRVVVLHGGYDEVRVSVCVGGGGVYG